MADTEAPLSDPRPILTFGAPEVSAIPTGESSSTYRPMQRPSGARQRERLAPQFRALQDAFESRRVELSAATPEDDPELVAVFDLAGSVDNFYRAASKVPGLEFLFDIEDEYVDPDDDFYYTDKGGDADDDTIPQHLYMVMTNAAALEQLIHLFQQWHADNSVTFEWGLGSLKQVFGLLHNIRRWEAQDRVRETGLLEEWRELAGVSGMQAMRAEIELWYRNDAARRDRARQSVERALQSSNGRVVAATTIPEIRYHGLLVEVPRAAIERVVADGAGEIALLSVEDIMFALPVPQQGIAAPQPSGVAPTVAAYEPSDGVPHAALLDGLPLSGHTSLNGRLVIDDPNDIASQYTASQRRHGTAMASLIMHGPLDAPGEPLRHKLYVHPVLQPHPVFPEQEIFPEDELLIDVLHRALRRCRASEGDTAGATDEIRIVNLSVGDPAKVFIRRMSPHARLLDWFSHRYNVLIVVSAGNHGPNVTSVDVPRSCIDDSDALQAEVLRALRQSERQRRLMAPSESINAITVGAAHSDGGMHRDLPAHLADPLPDGMPATYSSIGFGYRRGVKPDVLLPGGRMVYERPLAGDGDDVVQLRPTYEVEVAGLAVAAPGLAGELDGLALTCGTSNAAALATRSLARIFEAFETPGAVEGLLPDAELHPAMAKALFIHAASWGSLKERAIADLGLSGSGMRHSLTKLLGYGVVADDRIATATTRRVVLLGGSTIRHGQRHTYRVPLPAALHASTEWRRLTVTLAWISATNPSTQKYRMARLRFGDVHEQLVLNSHEADRRAAVRGTVQHEVLEGQRAAAFQDGDSLAINVDCRVDVGSTTTMTNYGIAASLEVGVSVQADIHAQIRQSLQVRVAAQERARVQT